MNEHNGRCGIINYIDNFCGCVGVLYMPVFYEILKCVQFNVGPTEEGFGAILPIPISSTKNRNILFCLRT